MASKLFPMSVENRSTVNKITDRFPPATPTDADLAVAAAFATRAESGHVFPTTNDLRDTLARAAE